jgi:hypothetical protein
VTDASPVLVAGQRRRHPSGRILTLKRIAHAFVEAAPPGLAFPSEEVFSPADVASWPLVERAPRALACPWCDDDVFAEAAPGNVITVPCPNCKRALWVDFSIPDPRCSLPWYCAGEGPRALPGGGCHEVDANGRGCMVCGAHFGLAWNEIPSNVVNGNVGRWMAGEIACIICGLRCPTAPRWEEPKEGECRCFTLHGDALVAALREKVRQDRKGFAYMSGERERERAKLQGQVDDLQRRITGALAEIAGVGAPDGPVARARALLSGPAAP